MKLFLPLLSRFGIVALVLASTLCAFDSGVARADTINVDFNYGPASPTYGGRGAAPDSGTVWNGFGIIGSTDFLSNLVNSTGAVTGVAISENCMGVDDAPNYGGASGNNASALLRDFIYTSASQTVRLTGLTAGRYDLYLYGVGKYPAGMGGISRTAFTVGGITQTTLGPSAATIDLTLGEDYVVFNNVIADASNGISITYAPPAGETMGAFNGLQLQSVTAPVPEPSTWVMMALGLGALGMVTWKRKRGEMQSSTDFAV